MLLSSSAYADFTLYGQLNRAGMTVRDGHQTSFYSVDNDASSSRLGVKGSMKHDGLTVGGKLEVEYEAASSAKVSQTDRGTDTNVGIRHALAYLKSDLGKISVGHGDTATNGISEITLNGADDIIYNDMTVFGGGHKFHAKNSNAEAAGPTMKSTHTNLDGFSRANLVRYDTPSFNGFMLSASHSTEKAQVEATDIALRYEGGTADFDVEAGWGWGKYSRGNQAAGTNRQSQWAGSISGLHKDSGFNVTLAAGQQKLEAANSSKPKYWYVGLGKQCDMNSWGMTNFAVDYYNGKHFADGLAGTDKDAKSRAYGLGVQQHLKAWNSSVYGGVRQYKFKRTTQKYDNIVAVMLGLKVKFSIS